MIEITYQEGPPPSYSTSDLMRQVFKFAVLALSSLLAAPQVSADGPCFGLNSNHCATVCCMEMGYSPSHEMSAGSCETQNSAALTEALCTEGSCSVSSSQPLQSTAQTKLEREHVFQCLALCAPSGRSSHPALDRAPADPFINQPARYLLLKVFRI